MAANASRSTKTVADPNASYDSIKNLWKRSRAACSGERFVKEMDAVLDVATFTNMLIPFSPSMTPQQYSFYRMEAEWPGITAMYAKIVVGGLLRKKPQLKLPDGIAEEVKEWILSEFTKDSGPMSAFLDEVLWEELQTSRAWVFVDYPVVTNRDAMSREDVLAIKPFPIIWKAESVINWKVDSNPIDGTFKLSRVVVRGYEENFETNEFHPVQEETIWVHELDDVGKYQIRKFQKKGPSANVPVINGQKQINTRSDAFELIDTITGVEANGERLTCIPAWPLNGSIEALEPMLGPIIDKEIALYNKMSRRNHLLYGAATYTPVISSNMDDGAFQAVVDKGLGSWLKLDQGDTIDVLKPPTEALSDMANSIAASLEEMAKLGIRMLTPETSQSGVALDIRNAAQTSQLGTLNAKVSNQMSDIIAFMINWRYDAQLKAADVQFSLSEDFNPAPLGADWLRLVTEWYENGLLPRNVWLQILKLNDIIPPDYNDEKGQEEINADEMVITKREQQTFDNSLTLSMNGPDQQVKPPADKATEKQSTKEK